MKLRSFLTGLLALVVVLLLIGVGGFYWITANSPLKVLTAGAGQLPSAAIFVPKQAPVMVSLLVNPDDLKDFRQVVAAPGKRRQARAELVQFQQGLLASTGLDYERDVQPWLGDEVTLAITTLDIDRDRSNGKQPGYLLAIATKDPERSREFLQVFWQKRAIAGTDLTFEQYKGVKLIYNEVPVQKTTGKEKTKGKGQKTEGKNAGLYFLPSPSLASAVVGDQFVLFANDPKVLRDAITNVQAAELNLNEASFYTQALDTLTQPRIGLTFVNLPGLAEWLETESITTPKPSPEQKSSSTTKQPGQSQTLAIALELKRQGLVAETAMIDSNRKTTIAPALSKPVPALQYIPTESPLVAAGTNLDQLWQELSTSLANYGAVSQLVNQSVQDFEKQSRLNLPKDIFSWVDGDYALANLSAPLENDGEAKRKGKKNKGASADSTIANDWIFVTERETTDAAKPAIAHLDEIAKQQGYSVGAIQLGDQTVSAWTKLSSNNPFSKTLQAEVEGVHATVGKYELFATSLAAMEKALNAIDNSLAKSDRFQQAIAPFQQPNNGYLYLDWNEGRPLLEQRFPFLKVVELAGSPLFSHLQSFTVSSYGRKDGVQRSNIFFKLG